MLSGTRVSRQRRGSKCAGSALDGTVGQTSTEIHTRSARQHL